MLLAQWRYCLELTCLPLRGQRRHGVGSRVTGFPFQPAGHAAGHLEVRAVYGIGMPGAAYMRQCLWS